MGWLSRRKQNNPKPRRSELPAPLPGEKNPFLTDDGQLQPGIVMPKTWEASVETKLSDKELDNVRNLFMGKGYKIPVAGVTMTYTTPSGEHTDITYPDGEIGFTLDSYKDMPPIFLDAHYPVDTTGEVILQDWSSLIVGKPKPLDSQPSDQKSSVLTYTDILNHLKTTYGKDKRSVSAVGDKLHGKSVVFVPQTYADYVATCGNTEQSKFACRSCEWVGECK